ncbi:MAG: hypothetical protein R2747_02195 [Pyrinomonadaceae bacterium]
MKNKITRQTLLPICRELSHNDPDLKSIYRTYGPPPLWDRPAGFPTLVQIILEQQVSLSSARAAFDKLLLSIGRVAPEKLLKLGDDELKKIGFSRQKTAYVRGLAEAVLDDKIDLEGLEELPDAEAKKELTRIKGIGEWTSDIYLLMALLRPDVMPKGDLALHAAYQKLKGLTERPGAEEFIRLAEKWKPHRSVAARLLWHFYLSERNAPEKVGKKSF